MSKTVGIDLGTTNSVVAAVMEGGDFPDGSTITLDADGDELVVRWDVPGTETRTNQREEVTA